MAQETLSSTKATGRPLLMAHREGAESGQTKRDCVRVLLQEQWRALEHAGIKGPPTSLCSTGADASRWNIPLNLNFWIGITPHSGWESPRITCKDQVSFPALHTQRIRLGITWRIRLGITQTGNHLDTHSDQESLKEGCYWLKASIEFVWKFRVCVKCLQIKRWSGLGSVSVLLMHTQTVLPPATPASPETESLDEGVRKQRLLRLQAHEKNLSGWPHGREDTSPIQRCVSAVSPEQKCPPERCLYTLVMEGGININTICTLRNKIALLPPFQNLLYSDISGFLYTKNVRGTMTLNNVLHPAQQTPTSHSRSSARCWQARGKKCLEEMNGSESF